MNLPLMEISWRMGTVAVNGYGKNHERYTLRSKTFSAVSKPLSGKIYCRGFKL